MAFCSKCGEPLKENEKFCSRCGASADGTQQNQQYQKPVGDDVSQNKVMAVLAYIGILFLIPLLAAKDSPYARFHTNQGLVLFLCEAVLGVVVAILTGILTVVFWPLATVISALYGIVSLVFFIFMIMGIVNAVQGQQKELPLIGKFRILK